MLACDFFVSITMGFRTLYVFVVLDIGRSQHVTSNAQFLVYRDSKMIGKVQVLSVGASTSVAEVLPEYQRGTPRVGDLVIH